MTSKITSIQVASNGFVATTEQYRWDYETTTDKRVEIMFIAPDLRALADAIEGTKPTYHPDRQMIPISIDDFIAAKRLVREGRKIDAIKTVRSAFGPDHSIALKDAKEFVETIFEY
jgi:hypothetical protein